MVLYIHTQSFVLMYFHNRQKPSCLWSCTVSCDASSPRSHTQTHTWMQMCLLAMKKLSALICSLRPEDKSDHGDGGGPPALSSHPPSLPPISPARGYWAQVALEGGGRRGAIQAAAAALQSGSVSPKRPWCQEARHITARVTLKPTERNAGPWTHHVAPRRQEVDTLECIVYRSAPHWCHVDGIYSPMRHWYGSRVDLQQSADINVNKVDVCRGALISSAYRGGFKAAWAAAAAATITDKTSLWPDDKWIYMNW